ncbi:hypothetical protein KV205_15030 [Streptomyces sp. SKN60]|uniref:hypothetical protein n=1 Tax=Streptomyces sp. SKN60 TaxID=2855506 RepID=UPI00224659EB|nr:hypothetical protein [Streptomyces sp. SKN60]MCX2181838.1 hypothetical protein [Streptomyces sp. SKN60]
MGNWVVVAQYGVASDGNAFRTELVRTVTGSREEAREALRETALAYREPMREKRRRVFRLSGGDSYLVRVNGLVSETDTVLTIAELVYDSADPKLGPVDGWGGVPQGPESPS